MVGSASAQNQTFPSHVCQQKVRVTRTVKMQCAPRPASECDLQGRNTQMRLAQRLSCILVKVYAELIISALGKTLTVSLLKDFL